LLGPTVALTAVAALLLFVVLGHVEVAILAAAAVVLVGTSLLRRDEPDRPVHDDDPTPAVEISIPAVAREQMAEGGTIADLANRIRGRS
jgi:hypothetical protein